MILFPLPQGPAVIRLFTHEPERRTQSRLFRVPVWCRQMQNISFISRDTRDTRIFPSRLTACFNEEPGFNRLVLFIFLRT
ncbi:MAG: hypothetical protein V3V52_11060, partial [Candidatus Adiutricales bacterium]